MNPPVPVADGKLRGLDTLRGLGAVMVVIHHWSLAFYPQVVLGAPNPRHAGWEDWLQRFPGSLLVGGKFAVVLFFVLSGCVLSLRYVGPRGRDDRDLAAAILKRCFRLGPMVLAGILAVWALQRAGAIQSRPAAELSGSSWLATKPVAGDGLAQLVKVTGFNLFTRGREYNSPLWTIGDELYGSFLVFVLLLVLRRSTWRWGLYLGAMLWFRSPTTLPFVVGLILADLWVCVPAFSRWAVRPWVAGPALLLGLFLGSYPEGLQAAAGSVWSPWFPGLARLRSWHLHLGAVLVVSVVLGHPGLQRTLDQGWGRFLGRISYALYALHEPVLLTLGCAVFLRALPGQGYTPAALLAGGAILAVSVGVAECGTRWIDQPSVRLADWVARKYRATLER